MPTPDVNGAASMTQRTGGFLRPYSSEASKTRLRRRAAGAARSGREAEVVHQPVGDDEHRQQHAHPHQERHPEVGRLGDHPAEHRAAEHRAPADHLAAPEHGLERALVPRVVQRVDQPRLDGAGEEREARARAASRRPPTARTARSSPTAASRGASTPASVTCPSRYETRRPQVSATTPVGTSKSTMPAVKNAFAANASRLLRPASSRNSVLMPQMNEAASVLPSRSVR